MSAVTPIKIQPAAPADAGMKRNIDATGEAGASLTPELVFALCGPIGSPIHEVAKQIASLMTSDYGYAAETIRLSELIRMNASLVNLTIEEKSRFEDIRSLIAAGDALRAQFETDILAKLAIAKISGDRKRCFGDVKDEAAEADKPQEQRIRSHRICHIVDSVKNDSELRLLRLVYGESLLAIGVFSPVETRRENLERTSLSNDEIRQLIDLDSGEEFAHGQSVRDTFPKCDFFIRIDYPTGGATEDKAAGQLVEKLRRFLTLVFRTSVVTPTADENSMYAAASAGRNSACLSRQVGAAVTSSRGELLAVGWNDVPRTGGGLYGKPALLSSFSADQDHRCYALSGAKCFNDEEKGEIAKKIVESLVKANLLEKEKSDAAVKSVLADSRVRDLIEFSRAVHAEMHAILGACRLAGDPVLGSKLYVTTYPCHSCARHAVAAGIVEILYIEPYRKSLATRLHDDALTESADDKNRVHILQFDGVAPRRFIELFEHRDRKKDGVLRLERRVTAMPSTQTSMKAIPRLEEVIVAEVSDQGLHLLQLMKSSAEMQK